jgi:hypothetical protein
MEDALSATRAAVEEGIVAGGGTALVNALSALDKLQLGGDERTGVEILRQALEEPEAEAHHRHGKKEGERGRLLLAPLVILCVLPLAVIGAFVVLAVIGHATNIITVSAATLRATALPVTVIAHAQPCPAPRTGGARRCAGAPRLV